MWGRPASELLSSQLLLPVPRTVLNLRSLGVEGKAPEVCLPSRLQGKEALEGSEENQEGEPAGIMKAQPSCLTPWDSGPFIFGPNGTPVAASTTLA